MRAVIAARLFRLYDCRRGSVEPVAMRGGPILKDVLTIAELKARAKRRVPKMFFDYADSGAWTEGTYRANEDDFHKVKLRQRVLVDMTNRSLESEMIGEKVSMPVALAPTGLTGMQHADGEMLAAQAAEAFGVPFTLDQAYPFVRDATVAFGFPDIIFDGQDGFVKLLDRQLQTGADVVLGLFPANHPMIG